MLNTQQIRDWEELEASELERIARLEQMDATKRWAKYPKPKVFSDLWGYGSTLYKLQGDMNNDTLSPLTRKLAAEAFYKIIRKTKDKKLMEMRERLIRASKAGNEQAMSKITQEIRAYSYEDRETGLDD